MSSALVALRSRNFRMLWSGQLVSNAGSAMQSAALLWHVSVLVPPEQRPLALGAVGLVRVLPIIGFSFVSGVLADAIDRRRLMLVTQAGMGLAAAALAVLAFSHHQALWPIYILAAIGSAFGSFDGPARQALIPSLVPREHLPNAIALNTIMFQVASVVGPAVGGVVIASLGLGWTYALNAVSFLCVIVALLAMRDVPQVPHAERAEIGPGAVWEGLRFVFGSPLIRSTMLLDFYATLFASATALLPIYAQDILSVGAHGYGLLSAAPAAGAMAASLAMVRIGDRIRHRGRVLLGAVVAYGLATVGFGLSRSFALTMLCLALTGVFDTVSMVIRNVVRQLNTPDALRGRMTSVNMIFFMGGPQLGEMEAGLVAARWGAPFAVVSGGVACVLSTLWIGWRTPALRRYRREHEQAHAEPPLPRRLR